MKAEQQMIASLREAGRSPASQWVVWKHVSQGIAHCATCLKLNNCWFVKHRTPTWPQHPKCHCNLLPLPYDRVVNHATAYAAYTKFDPYLFDPDNSYNHHKQAMFESWGYYIGDASRLRAEVERQGLEKYIAGDYTIGLLNEYGQRISIRIEIPRKAGEGTVSFTTGWIVCPNGHIQLNTPYGGK